MIAFFIRQAKQPLLEYWIATVPQCNRQTQELAVVAETGDAVLSPSIGSAARLIVSDIIPRRTARAVVLTHRAPLSLAEVWAPSTPIPQAFTTFFDAYLLSVHGYRHL